MRTAIILLTTVVAALSLVSAALLFGLRRKTPLAINVVRRAGRAMRPLAPHSAGGAGSQAVFTSPVPALLSPADAEGPLFFIRFAGLIAFAVFVAAASVCLLS
jgi:hypothetical protein